MTPPLLPPAEIHQPADICGSHVGWVIPLALVFCALAVVALAHALPEVI